MPETQMVMTDTNGHALVEAKQPTPMMLLKMAMDQSLDADKLGQLLDLQMRWEAHEAKKAYITAKLEFQKNAPVILKTKKVAYQQVSYSHAELDKMWEILIPEMAKYNLGFSWRPEPSDSGKTRMSCVLAYSNGALAHSEVEATIEAPADTSGSKNQVQAIGSSSTYLQRYTLFAALGIVAKNQDNDGRTSESLSSQSVEDYLTTIQDASTIPELKLKYEAAKAAASRLSDADAVQQFLAAKDKRYKELFRK